MHFLLHTPDAHNYIHNRDDSDYLFIVAIEADLGDGRTIRRSFSLIVENLKSLDL
jgi:hypothetical protein